MLSVSLIRVLGANEATPVSVAHGDHATAIRHLIIYLILPYCDDFLIIIHGDSKEVWWQRELQAKAVVLEALERLRLTWQPTKGAVDGAKLDSSPRAADRDGRRQWDDSTLRTS